MKRNILERLADRLALTDSGCLVWTGCKTRDGYGQTKIGGRLRPVHVVVFEAAHGPVPAGLDVGHICHDEDKTCPGGACEHRACVDVEHLRAMTRSENILGGRLGDVVRARIAAITHCPAGHPYDEENTYRRTDRPAGGRGCRVCRREARRRCDARRRAAGRG